MYPLRCRSRCPFILNIDYSQEAGSEMALPLLSLFQSAFVAFQRYFGVKICEMIGTTFPGVKAEIALKNFLSVDDKKTEII
jgi:hypothetical protein